MNNNFAVLILSHGRADNVKTVRALNKCGYTGKWYIVLDDEDTTINEYCEHYGQNHIITFNKRIQVENSDSCDTGFNPNVVLYARNACFDIAKTLNLDYFLELDDDYTEFRTRIWDGKQLSSIYVRDLDSVIEAMLNFLNNTNCDVVAFAQDGDFIGGKGSRVYKKRIVQKAMNAFFCKTSRPFKFIGTLNEDVTTYVHLGSIGKMLFTVADISVTQTTTQKSNGGLTDAYLALGTYVKSFYSVIVNPSCVKIFAMGVNHKRIHHSIFWENAIPKIISSKFKCV